MINKVHELIDIALTLKKQIACHTMFCALVLPANTPDIVKRFQDSQPQPSRPYVSQQSLHDTRDN